MVYLDLVACEFPEQSVTVCVAWKIVGLWQVEGCCTDEFTTASPTLVIELCKVVHIVGSFAKVQKHPCQYCMCVKMFSFTGG